MIRGLVCFLLGAFVCGAQSQSVYVIDTVAGGAIYDGLAATSTPLNSPAGLLVDREGALWIADSGNQVIRRVNLSTGAMTVVVGGGVVLDDALAVSAREAQLYRPRHLAQDAAGNIFFSDFEQHRVRRLTPDGQVTTVVGTGEAGFSGDGGPARLARLNQPVGLAFDPVGNLYIGERGTCRIRRVDTAGNISTYAGNGRCGVETGNGGPAINAALGVVEGLAFDSGGNLHFITSRSVRRIDRASGTIFYVIGDGISDACTIGGSPSPSGLCAGYSLAFDAQDTLYFNSDGVFKLEGGVVSQITGALGAQNTGVALDRQGNLFVAYRELGLVRRRRLAGSLGEVTIAGTTSPFDGPAREAALAPGGVALDVAGNVYIAERRRNRVRRFHPGTVQISTVVGGGSLRAADGLLATAVDIGLGGDLFVDPSGNMLFSDVTALWKVDSQTQRLTRIAGAPFSSQPNRVHSGDGGLARDATFGRVDGIVMDAAGNIFVADSNTNRVRRIDAATGIINTIVGDGTFGYSGDGGPATAAAIGSPQGLALDRDGNLLLCQGGGRPLIRRVNLSTGVITTLQARTRPGGPLEVAEFSGVGGPHTVALDREGSILVLFGGAMIRKIRISDGLLETIAGSTVGFFGDGGLATLARMNTLAGSLALDRDDNIYLGDGDNGRLRKLTPTLIRPTLSLSPSTLSFTVVAGAAAPAVQAFTISSRELVPFNWTLEVSTVSGGNWLRAGATTGTTPSSVTINVEPSSLAPGNYRGAITVRAPDAGNSPQSVEVELTVQPPAGSVLGVSQQFLTFQAVQGGASPPSQSISISNTGSGSLNWSVTTDTSAGGSWLRISAALGTAPSLLSISPDISGLTQGVYQARVVVRNLAGGDPVTIAVVLTVTRTQPTLLPTQTGFLFVGIEGSLVIGPQSFAIQNAGQGSMDWQIQVNLAAGGDWLRVSPLSGTSVAGQAAPSVTLQVDPSKLRAGVSVGLLTISGTGASNSPQTGIVLVSILPRGSLPVGTLSPLGLIFTATAGATGTLTQGLTVASAGGQALQFLARTRTQAGGNWLSVSPEHGALLSSSESANLNVQANPGGLSTGVYFGTVTLAFGTGATQEVAVALVVAPVSTTPSPGLEIASLSGPAEACTPRRLVLVETKLGNPFTLQTGWPIPILARVVNDCGTAVTSATVIATFTSGDGPLTLQSLRDGTYSATWVPVTQGHVGVTVRAAVAGLEDGVVQFAGKLGLGGTLPLVFRDGWVNAASFDRFKPLAPGMIFSVFGSNLADGRNFAPAVPLPRSLGNLKVSLGGVDVPLFYADGGQVNGQVPFELATVGTASLVASGRGSAGAPGTVTIVGAQPGVFTISQSGTGQGVVLDGQYRVADSTNPVKAGDVVQIYATGLGLTQPAVSSGAATPAAPLSNVVAPVKVSIGGLDAPVDFAGLAPGFVGLYQVNARVPAGVTTGSAVPLVFSQNGVASNTVTIAVR